MKRARLRKRILTARTSTPVLAQPGESLSLFKIMSNEIKVGDKVRVRKDAPKMYLRGFDHIFTGVESVVSEVEDDNAVIIFNTGHINSQITIPLKYLVKVEDEEKEARFKVGDRVEELVSRKSGRVLGIDGDFVVVGFPYDKEKNYWHIDSVELVEPTEQTEAEKKPNVGSIKIPVEVDLTDSYWDAYTADLAKEVAVILAGNANFTDEKEKAAYVAGYAREIVENLKKSEE